MSLKQSEAYGCSKFVLMTVCLCARVFEVIPMAIDPKWMIKAGVDYAQRIQDYERKQNVPWAELSTVEHPTIVIQFRWIHTVTKLLNEETKYYRVPRSNFLADCYWYYLAEESKRVEPTYSRLVTWWQFLSLIGNGKGDWSSDLGTEIDKPTDKEVVFQAHWCHLPLATVDKFYIACVTCKRRWDGGICETCKVPVSAMTRSKTAL